jgi:glycerophosphoryl diester phosphodiesterase
VPDSPGYLDGPKPRAFAHRGWHVGDLAGLENTAVAFRRALDEGFRYLETDVHVTADGILVAFHDSILDRVTDGTGPIAAQRWRDLRDVRIGGREPIPLMADLLADFPAARFNIDAKSDAAVQPLADLVTELGARPRVCVASFLDQRVLRLRQALGPDVAASLGRGQVMRLMARARHVPLPLRLRKVGAVAVQVPVRSRRVAVVTSGFIRTVHKLGLEVHVWTVDDPGEMHRLLDLGADGLMTDRPDLLRQVLRDRGSWQDA